MTHFLGIDLGTSSVKVVITNEQGQVLGLATHPYPINIPQVKWAEQQPQDWWQATIFAVRHALSQYGNTSIDGIGLSGQMHGTVLISHDKLPIGQAIIWADQRSIDEAREIASVVGSVQILSIAGTLPASGFMASTLRWIQKYDPARLEKSRYCLLPKDYVRLCLTGEIATDVTDASATLLFDVSHRQWSSQLIQSLQLPDYLWPPAFESASIVGSLRRSAAEALGLHVGVPVVAGCADQVAQAIGNGLFEPGTGSITIGTGGQIFVPLMAPRVNPDLHTFCHAPTNRWYVMGTTQSAGLSLRWLRDLLNMSGEPTAYETLTRFAADVPAGADGLLFLPYLVGERTILTTARVPGAFIGLTLQHQSGHLARAVMEGVAFAMRKILETLAGMGISVEYLIASGGGLSSNLWRQITADVTGKPLRLYAGVEKAAVGGAMTAALGIGTYRDYGEVRDALATSYIVTEPNSQNLDLYNEQYCHFLQNALSLML